MLPKTRMLLGLAAAVALTAGVRADDLTASLTKGTPDLKSAGALTFGPEGILFVADPQGAAVFAIDTGDRTPDKTGTLPKVDALDQKIAAMLGVTPKDILINDLAVNPVSGNTYISVSRGRGPQALPALLRVTRANKIEEVPLKDVKFAKTTLPNAPAAGGARQDTVTDMAFTNGRLYVAGLSNEEFKSRLRSIPFPFQPADQGASIEIFHGAHGKFETASPVRTFTVYDIAGEPNLLCAYTCTPLVKVPVAQLKPGSHVKGTTIAELGNRNRPLDMVVYRKDDKDYILMANNSRGLMKITTDNIDKIAGITEPVRNGGTAGLKYETIPGMEKVQHLDLFDKTHAMILIQGGDGSFNLMTMPLP
jgi:hypothetical protein